MNTLKDHISAIRLIIRNYEDDSKYTDKAIAFFLAKANASTVSKQKQRHFSMDDWNTTQYCVKLELSDTIPCIDCLPIETCKVSKSVYKIPRPLNILGRSMIRLYTIDGKELDKTRRVNYALLDPIKKNYLQYDVVNNFIVVYDTKVLELIIVEGMWEDITAWQTIPYCDNEGNEDETKACYDISKDDYPIFSEDSLNVYKQAVELLLIAEQKGELDNMLYDLQYPH